MHNLHFITINANSAEHACELVDEKFNGEKDELDFSKLDVNPDDFRELDEPYDEEEYDSFIDYLTEIIDPDNMQGIYDLYEQLETETFEKISDFLKSAGYDDFDSENHFFNISVLGALNHDETDKKNYWFGIKDIKKFTKSYIDKILSKEFGKEIDCFGDIEEYETSLDCVGITSYCDKISTLPKFIVMLDVKS
jgi:hypothetical protein